jgi:hypothetical protein
MNPHQKVAATLDVLPEEILAEGSSGTPDFLVQSYATDVNTENELTKHHLQIL